MLPRLVLLVVFVFFTTSSGTFVTPVQAQGSTLDTKKTDTQIDNAKYVFELFVLDRLPPGVSDFVGLVKELPKYSKIGLIALYRKKQIEAMESGDYDKADRYYALMNCMNTGDCASVRRFQARNKAKHQAQSKAKKQNLSPLGQQGKKALIGGILNTGKPPAPTCPDGQRYCYGGTYGPGGCYHTKAQNCTEGLICRRWSFACKLPGQAAYCERAFEKCKVKPKSPCPAGQWLCPPGPNGKGRCIRPGETCIRGLVCRKGACVCKLPNIPAYCAPCGAICQPRPKPAPKVLSPCPAGLKYCPPGVLGRGGCIRPYQSCIKGLVCPTGYFYCKLPGEAAYCARPGSRCVSKKKPVQTPLVPPPPRTFTPSRCAPPGVWCPAGAYGPGRCYVRGAQRCIRGMV